MKTDDRARGEARAMRLASVAPPPAARLLPWVEHMRGVRALVWGDFVLDEYWRCLTRRVSREAPVLVLDWQSRSAQGGGAANAALNLAALGARVSVLGWIGRDESGRELRGLLERAGVDTHGLLEHPHASTVVKIRVVAGSIHTALQQVVRVDRGTAFPLDRAARAALAKALARVTRETRAVILSDYGYDSVTPELARGAIAAWRAHGAAVGLDARYRLGAYREVTLATPNESEAAAAAGLEAESERDLERIAARLMRAVRPQHLIVTRGRDGLTLWSGRAGQSLAAHGGAEAVDVTGAGDAVVATATLALAAGAPPREAAALANVAGSVAVSRRGAVAVGAGDLRTALGAGRARTHQQGATPKRGAAETRTPQDRATSKRGAERRARAATAEPNGHRAALPKHPRRARTAGARGPRR
jgi:rfaE bifunctional protein kinase chain/domain